MWIGDERKCDGLPCLAVERVGFAYMPFVPLQVTHSAAASMAALDKALGPAPAATKVLLPPSMQLAAEAKAEAAAKPVAKAAAADKAGEQSKAVIKPAVKVHHVIDEAIKPLASLNHGQMFMGEMFKDIQAKPRTVTAKSAKPTGDDKTVKMMPTMASAQSLAMAGAEKEDSRVPAVIRKADGNILSDPFTDKAVPEKKAGGILWNN